MYTWEFVLSALLTFSSPGDILSGNDCRPQPGELAVQSTQVSLGRPRQQCSCIPLPPPALGRQCEWSLPFALSMACWEEDTRYKFTAGKANWKTSTVSITQFLPLGIEVPWGFYLYLGTWVGLRIRIVSGHTLHLLPLLGSKRQEKSGKVNV